jgi:hypothetical protein
MAEPIDTKLLSQHWVRSREEDTPTEEVYRPSGYPLPPSRGRTGLEFSDDGTFKRIGIGATDVSRVTQGTWQIASEDKKQVSVKVEGESNLIKIQDLSHDRLAIKKAH